MFWRDISLGYQEDTVTSAEPIHRYQYKQHINPCAGIESKYQVSSILKFFSPVFLGCSGDKTGSVNFEKFWPHMGFPPEIFVSEIIIF